MRSLQVKLQYLMLLGLCITLSAHQQSPCVKASLPDHDLGAAEQARSRGQSLFHNDILQLKSLGL